MGLSGKVVSQINITSDGIACYELFRYKPCDISNISPDIIESVDLLAGHWGAVGSVTFWTWKQDGKKVVTKTVVEAIDEMKKSITTRVIGGDLDEWYNSFKFSLNVESNGEDNLVTWTLEYEKKFEAVPEPHAMMDLILRITKDVERKHLLVPN